MRQLHILIAFLIFTQNAFAQVSITMKIDNITSAEGDKLIAFEGIGTQTYVGAIGGGGGTGKPTVENIKIKKALSISSQLNRVMLSGQHLSKVEFEFQDNTNTLVYKITLTDVVVTKFSYLSAECPNCQSLSNEVWFAFSKIQYADPVNNKTVTYSSTGGVVTKLSCMKRISWVVLLVLQGMAAIAQIGAGSELGVTRIADTPSLGIGTAAGRDSLPRCNPAMTVCASPLPLIWLDFSGKRVDESRVDLQWKTAREISNTGFWVQRSFGDDRAFRAVFFVPALQNGDFLKLYQRPDTNAYPGKTWYRLQQVDLDGKFSYSRSIVVDGYAATGSLRAFPNPSTGTFYLRYPPAPDGRPYEIRVYSAFGQLVYQGRTLTVDLTKASSGTYIVECLADTVEVTRIVILR